MSGVPILRLRSAGRGNHYYALRGLIESCARLLYRRDWPAAVWALYPHACRVECVRKRLAILPPRAPSVRVGFVSDIHIGPTTPARLLDAAFERLAGESLDLLLLGGDYVFLDATPDKAARLAALVSKVPAARKFAVLGNHDLWTDHALIEQALTGAGVELITNRTVAITRELALIGLDEPWTGRLDTARAIEGIGAPSSIIVLCHSPDGWPAARQMVEALPGAPRGLYVCGHTHGGHIAAPWGPLVIPGRVGWSYPHGLHHLPPLDLYVSRGVGGIELPMRTFAPPDVAVFELVAG